MKQLSSSSRFVLLFITTLSVVFGINVDNALQYRQQSVPIGTGPTTSSATQTPSSPTASNSAAASSTPLSSTADQLTISSTADQLTTSASSAVISETISRTSDIVTTSVATPQSPLTSSRATSGPNSRSQPSVTSTSPETTPSSTGRSLAGSATISLKPVSSRTQQIVLTVTTVIEGNTRATVLTTSILLAVSSTASTSTSSPTLANGDRGSKNSGLEPSQKRVIIGVVVGIGGAILLGGIGVVAWRIWGKRKQSADEDHELMNSQPGSSGREKRSSVSGNSPFRSTLDQYHNPAGPVNTASNF